MGGKLLHFTTFDGKAIDLRDATPLVGPEMGDTVSESVAGKLPLEMWFHEGCERLTNNRAYAVQISLADTVGVAKPKFAGWLSGTGEQALALLDDFNPLELIPDALSEEQRRATATQFVEYYARISQRFKTNVREALE